LKLSFAAVLGVAAFLSLGCGVGDAPAGMSNEDAKAAIARMKPEDKIRAIANSPMPGPAKEKEFAKIEAETGVKASDVLQGSGGGPPRPGG
jgi:hypothetical protein